MACGGEVLGGGEREGSWRVGSGDGLRELKLVSVIMLGKTVIK